MPRPEKMRCICSLPKCGSFGPLDTFSGDGDTLVMTLDEYEAIRLLDYMGFSQEACALRMNVSRPTVVRIYESARRKMAEAIVTGKKIEIRGGSVTVCTAPRPECADEPYCCHRPKI